MADRNNFQYVMDPIKLARICWPKLLPYKKEVEIVRSVWENDWTNVSAAHKLGKDWSAGLIALLAFLSRDPCRIVTHSVDGSQLEQVLWGEIYALIDSSKYPLRAEQGGPLMVNHLHVRKVHTNGPKKGQLRPKSYLIGRQVATPEGMSGHHLPRMTHYRNGLPIPADRLQVDDWCTLFIGDECSGVEQTTIDKATEWAHRILLIGNPYECNNAFRWAVEGCPHRDDYPTGDIPRDPPQAGYRRKVFQMSWRDSPNVQLALAQIEAGGTPTGEVITPGVLSWHELLNRRREWDEVKKQVGLEGKWYKSAAALMFPPKWLDRAELAENVKRCLEYPAEAIGIDPAEGGDGTCMAAVNRYGLKDLITLKTKDTAVITSEAMAFVKRHNVPWDRVGFDRGGGGKQHADRLKQLGYGGVRTVDFGGAVSPEFRIGRKTYSQERARQETRHVFFDMRAQLYGEWMDLMDPAAGYGYVPPVVDEAGKVVTAAKYGLPFALPVEFAEVRRQIAVLPRMYDNGKLRLLEKSRPRDDDPFSQQPKRKTWKQLVGKSPDEADAVAVAIHCMLHELKRLEAGTPGFVP